MLILVELLGACTGLCASTSVVSMIWLVPNLLPDCPACSIFAATQRRIVTLILVEL